MPKKKTVIEVPFPTNGAIAVCLHHVPNPDIEARGDNTPGYWHPTAPSRKRHKIIKSWKEASEVCLAFIRKHELGGGNWAGGAIQQVGHSDVLAHVSFNGRVWEGASSNWNSETKEIKI